MLLIFAFASGYLSESFNLMLREGLNHLIPNFGVKASRLAGAADVEAALSAVKVAAEIHVPAPRDLTGLRAALRGTTERVLAETEANVADRMDA
jgi:hypothetical protein